MTFPSVRSLGVTRSYSGTNNTFAAPAGVVAGDLLLAFIGLDSPQSLPWSSRIPAGWTMIVSDTVTTNAFHAIYGIAYKVAGGSEPSNYAFDMGGGGFGRIAAIQGVSASTPINVSAATNNASSTTPSVPSVTTTAAECLLVGFYGITDSGSTYTFTPPGGATEIIDEKASTQNACFGAYTRTLTSAGASGADTVTVSAARAVWACAVAIAPVQLPGTLTGDVALNAVVAAGSLASSSSDLSGNVVLDAALPAGTLGVAPGVLTLGPVHHPITGVRADGATLPWVSVTRLSDGQQVAILTAQTVNGSGNLVLTHGSIMPGVAYAGLLYDGSIVGCGWATAA